MKDTTRGGLKPGIYEHYKSTPAAPKFYELYNVVRFNAAAGTFAKMHDIAVLHGTEEADGQLRFNIYIDDEFQLYFDQPYIVEGRPVTEMALYRPQYGKELLTVRPADEFAGNTDVEKKRFRFVG